MKHLLRILTAIVGCSLASSCTRYDERELVSRFEANKTAFSRLGSLSLGDTWLHRLTEDRLEADGPQVDEARLNEYRRLFSELQIEGGLLRRVGYKDVVFFIVGSFGLPSGGTLFGYAFSPSKRIGRVVEEIYPNTLNERGIVYREIGDGWYLFFSVEG